MDVLRWLRGQVGGHRARRDGPATFPVSVDPSLLVGLAPFDDAAIYRIDDTTALVSTTDFFPPLVDDPADYGAIAAANACSDVFAMGGRVVLAINVAAFPEHFPRWAMAAIFAAAAEVVTEAGGTVAGGHTIRNPEPVFGLAVQGLVHPDRVFRKGGARPGDAVLLSKPLGTGLTLAGGDADEKAAASPSASRHSTARRRRCCSRSARLFTPSPMSPGTGWPATDGRSPSAVVARLVPRRRRPRGLPRRTEPPPSRGVRTGGDARNRDYVADHLDSTAAASAEALVLRPPDIGRPARRRRSWRRPPI